MYLRVDDRHVVGGPDGRLSEVGPGGAARVAAGVVAAQGVEDSEPADVVEQPERVAAADEHGVRGRGGGRRVGLAVQRAAVEALR